MNTSAVALVALIYSVGYTWATFAGVPWLKRLEKINVTASLSILGILILLFTPLADPARLAVNSQVARLTAGKTAAEKFDYQFLRFNAARYGADALAVLASNANSNIALRARMARANDRNFYQFSAGTDPATTEPPLSHMVVYPKGAVLPRDFTRNNLPDDIYAAPCLQNGSPCEIIIEPNPRKGAPMLIVHHADSVSSPVFGRDRKGKWSVTGSIRNLDCPGVLGALRNGAGNPVRPDHDDLQVGGVRLIFTPEDATENRCPAPQPAPKGQMPAPQDATAPTHMGPAFGRR